MAAQGMHLLLTRTWTSQTLVIDLVGFARPSKEGAVRAAIVATRTFKKRREAD